MNFQTQAPRLSASAIAAATMLAFFACAPVGPAKAEGAPVPKAFIDNGPGELKKIDVGRYCRMVYGSTARQAVGPNKAWNEWQCLVGKGFAHGSTGIDFYDVCSKLYGAKYKPVNNTGSAYNWYCKLR